MYPQKQPVTRQKLPKQVTHLLEEIQAICGMSEAPAAIRTAKDNPAIELGNCQRDLATINQIVQSIMGVAQ